MIRRLTLALTLLATLAVPGWSQERIEFGLVAGDEIVLEPGYAVGDVTITDDNVADFSVQTGRTTLLLLARVAGLTLLNLTDEQRVLRTIVTITVESRELRDLREFLTAFPSVRLQQLGAKAVVTGQVKTKADLDTIAALAKAAGADSAVTLAAPKAAPAPLEFDVAILEASAAFKSGSYATGVEPSGPVLFQQVVRVPNGDQGELFVPASALGDAARHAARPPSGAAAPASVGIRMTLAPGPRAQDKFSTVVRIETNLPVEQAPDPTVMRRARWELEGGPDDPFALAGSELLAVPSAVRSSGSAFGRLLRAVAARLPGVGGMSAPALVADIPYYDRKKKTQLVALFKAREVPTP